MHIFAFASFHTIFVVILQKNEDGYEKPIAFFSKSLQPTKLKYKINEKKAYALVKVVKAFRCYLVGAIVIAFVPSATLKDMFSQQEVSGRRCRWINRIQEFNIDIQITKLVRGQGLAKLMTETNLDANQINFIEEENRAYICDMDNCKWYADVIYYLQHMVSPPHLSNNEKRTVKLHALRFVIISGKLWQRSQDNVLLKCVSKEQLVKILTEMHNGACGGHYISKKTTHKV